MLKLTPEIMLKRFMRGREKHLYNEMRIQFSMRLWDDLKMRIYENIENEEIRFKINILLKNSLVKTLWFINNIKKNDYDKGQRKNKECYNEGNFKWLTNKKVKTIEEVLVDYNFKGDEKVIATMIMNGYNDNEIKDKLSISNHYYQLKKNKIKKIIKEANDV